MNRAGDEKAAAVMPPTPSEYEFHPLCQLFPLMSEAELDELASDIKKNGLRDPPTRWTDEGGKIWLIDGRNRVEACSRAGYRITLFEDYEGTDPAGFIVSRNIRRRHLTQEQKREDR
jgi:hypothetical protein